MYSEDFREVRLVVEDEVVRGYVTSLRADELASDDVELFKEYERYFVAYRENGTKDDWLVVRRLPFSVLHAATIYVERAIDRYTNEYGELILVDGVRIEFV